MRITLQSNDLLLDPEKIVFSPTEQALLLSDLHLTKENHFRKNGIPIPGGTTTNTLKRLSFVMEKYRPVTVYLLGDLFHSDINKGVGEFKVWRESYPETRFKLITGNHDVLDNHIYSELGVDLCGHKLLLGGLLLTHEPVSEPKKLNICGHIHPGITLSGMARQNLHLPCFYFNGRNFFLPSFGEFTGSKTVTPKKGDKVYAIADKKIIEVR